MVEDNLLLDDDDLLSGDIGEQTLDRVTSTQEARLLADAMRESVKKPSILAPSNIKVQMPASSGLMQINDVADEDNDYEETQLL